MQQITVTNKRGNPVTLSEDETRVYLNIAKGDKVNGRPTKYSRQIQLKGMPKLGTHIAAMDLKEVISEVELPEGRLGWQVLDERHFDPQH